VLLLKTDQHADSAVGAKIIVQNRAEKPKVANMVLLTKHIYPIFWYRYMGAHIFTAFAFIIPQPPPKSNDCYIGKPHKGTINLCR
jgi:hypothetical protein